MTDHKKIEECAAEFLMRRAEPGWSLEDDERLRRWLAESHAHQAAFWRLEAAWERADVLASAPRVSTGSAHRTTFRRYRSLAAVAASVMILFAIFYTSSWSLIRPDRHRFATTIGESARVTLNDGTTIDVSSLTSFSSAFSSGAREVWLDDGDVYLDVAHEQRPFIIHSASIDVTVLGTKFLMGRRGENLNVGVIQGRVRVSSSSSTDFRPIDLKKDDMVRAVGASATVIRNAPGAVENGMAWREGMLRFDEVPLGDAAKEFNRHNEIKLIVGEDVATLPIGGAFRARNVDSFVRILHDVYELRIEREGNSIVIKGNGAARDDWQRDAG